MAGITQRYTLDTNIVSHIMQGRDIDLLAQLGRIAVGQAVMSSVTLEELEYGLHRKRIPTAEKRTASGAIAN